ncbi:MAG TPA: FGGY-family carbohydrate kinase [Actinomycetes bacterium]|nr:FGGY-family carbohydrate kinase [Actinomycetes bacterium]
MGVDFGTGSVRVGIFDSEGTAVAFHVVEYETRHPRPGWAEQDLDEWWSCVVASSREAMEKSGLAPEEIVGISVDATASTVLAIDDKYRHIRSAIMWMDVRAADQARRLGETGDPALKYNGFGPVSAEFGLPKALWLKENEPDTWSRAARVGDCADWAIQRLTGEATTSVNTVSGKYYYDRDEGGFPVSLYEAVGVGDLLDKTPRRVLDLGAQVGELTGDAADELGLEAGTPVAEGGIDAHVGALGLGVVSPGMLALITGSSHVIIGQAADPVHDPGFWGAYTDAIVPGQYTVEAGQASTGSVVAWFKNTCAGGPVAEAAGRGVDPYVVLNELAAEVPIGSEGLVVLDYFQGNRSPYTDPHARGLISGLSLRHGPGHLFRAILEGICFGTELIFRTLRGHDFELRSIAAAGGATRSELWMQLHADVANVPVSIPREPESPVLGAAMLAAVGAGVHPDLPTAAAEMVHVERTIDPDPERHERYGFFMDRYTELYPQVKDVMHKVTSHVAGSGGTADG